MDNEKFQELILERLDSIDKSQEKAIERLDSIDKFQEEALERFASIDKFQKNALERFASIDKFQDLVQKLFSNVFNRLDSLEKSQLKLEMRMENEVIDKIKVLLDGYMAHEEKLDDLSRDVRYLVNKVTYLEKLAK